MSGPLILRLSSLGDVVLATAALEALPPGEKADWVVKEELAGILEGHPRIRVVHSFRTPEGFRAWISLCIELAASEPSQVLDLHRSWRTGVARLVFALLGSRVPWVRVEKERWKHWGYCFFKGLWPRGLRPRPWVERFARAAGGTGAERPNLAHLARGDRPPELSEAGRPYICVMADSRWPGKRVPAEKLAKLIERKRVRAVVLGAAGDPEGTSLVGLLGAAGFPCVNGVGRWSLPQCAAVLGASAGYLGADTGLAHLAEAVGRPARVFFGPTAPDGGFGPWRADSRPLATPIWCRPCGKDGRFCIRPFDRHACLRSRSLGSVS